MSGFLEFKECAGCGELFPIRSPYARGQKWCSGRCRKRQYGDPCVDCGTRTVFGAEDARVAEPRCERCAQSKRILRGREARESRRREIERRWLAGESARQIATALTRTPSSISVEISTMRTEDGYNLPYRNPASAVWHRAHPEVIAHARAVLAEQRKAAA